MDKWINKGDRGGGRPPWAYMIDRPFPECLGHRKKWHFRSIYNCLGICQGGIYTAKCVQKTANGYEAFTIKGYGAPNFEGFKGFNVIQDIRTIWMITHGCCPPELLYEFLGTEGIPS
jgi:hypothetical protein